MLSNRRQFCNHSFEIILICFYLILLLCQFVRNLSNLRPIQVNADGTASFELDMDLIEPSSSIYLYKVGVKTFFFFFLFCTVMMFSILT